MLALQTTSKKGSSSAKEYLCYLHPLDALEGKRRSNRMGRRTSNSMWLVIKMQLLRIRFLFVVFFLILIALSNCNLHTIKSTYYKVYSVIIFSPFIVVQPSLPSSFRASPSLQKVPSIPLADYYYFTLYKKIIYLFSCLGS